jgi:hypothetical protein
MKIDRHNYEEFFILYMDNELSVEERRSVEEFASIHPDLKDELDLLMQSRLIPDEALVFPDKDHLLKSGGYSSINKNNYEEWFLSYNDNELNNEQRGEVETFITNHPSLKNELSLLQAAILESETIVFPYKESLYRHEEKARVVGINWKKYAAAAALLLAVSSTALMVFRKEDKADSGTVAGVTPKNTTVAPTQSKPSVADIKIDEPTIAKTDDPIEVKKEKKEIEKPRLIKENNVEARNLIAEVEKPVKKEERQEIAVVIPEKKNNNLPDSKNNPNMPLNTISNNPIAGIDTPVTNDLTDNVGNNVASNVTSNTGSSFIQTANQELADEPGGNKNKLRGFFRKLTRTFEKNTNIKATDDEDRLLVGGLAIRL